MKARIHFIGQPKERKHEDGTPDWGKEIDLLEKALDYRRQEIEKMLYGMIEKERP